MNSIAKLTGKKTTRTWKMQRGQGRRSTKKTHAEHASYGQSMLGAASPWAPLPLVVLICGICDITCVHSNPYCAGLVCSGSSPERKPNVPKIW